MNADVTIIHRPVKHARLRVSQDGTVRLIAPNDFEPERIANILAKKDGWIRRNQENFQNRSSDHPESIGNQIVLHGKVAKVVREIASKSLVEFDRCTEALRIGAPPNRQPTIDEAVREYAHQYLRDRLWELSERHGFTFNRLFIRSQRTKWGNCSRLKNISLNWKLVQLPEFVSSYVILHELLHTRIMNHSERFWVTMRALDSNTGRAVEWLIKNGFAWSI